MAVDLTQPEVSALNLVAWLCIEARVCLHDDMGNKVQVDAAQWDLDDGLIVTDEHGQRWHLRITAESEPDRYPEMQDSCPKCGGRSYSCNASPDYSVITCSNCYYIWREPNIMKEV